MNDGGLDQEFTAQSTVNLGIASFQSNNRVTSFERRRTCAQGFPAVMFLSASLERNKEMALNIKDPEADMLARKLAKATGESVTVAVRNAIREKIERLPKLAGRSRIDELMAIGRRCAAIDDLDTRTADEILGYDDHGLPQ